MSYYFTTPRKRLALSLCYNGSLFVNATKINQFKAKDFELKDYTPCLGNISKDFTIDNMKKDRIKRKFNFFSVDFDVIDNNNILDIHKDLMKRK